MRLISTRPHHDRSPSTGDPDIHISLTTGVTRLPLTRPRRSPRLSVMRMNRGVESPMTRGRLDGLSILIVGGTSGLGLAAAHACLRESARVTVVGRDDEALPRAATELGTDVVAIGWGRDGTSTGGSRGSAGHRQLRTPRRRVSRRGRQRPALRRRSSRCHHGRRLARHARSQSDVAVPHVPRRHALFRRTEARRLDPGHDVGARVLARARRTSPRMPTPRRRPARSD